MTAEFNANEGGRCRCYIPFVLVVVLVLVSRPRPFVVVLVLGPSSLLGHVHLGFFVQGTAAGKLNELFGADTTDQDQLVYVNHVIKGKLLESQTLRQQAVNNTKEQFANSPDLKTELLNAIMGALDAHTSMSTKALNSPKVQAGLKDILLNHSRLYESLRAPVPGAKDKPYSPLDGTG